jgi:hypothetical protein
MVLHAGLLARRAGFFQTLEKSRTIFPGIGKPSAVLRASCMARIMSRPPRGGKRRFPDSAVSDFVLSRFVSAFVSPLGRNYGGQVGIRISNLRPARLAGRPREDE